MVKLITKKISLWKFTTFSSREIKDVLLMYFIKKNFKSYNELDLEEIIASKQYQNFIKKYKSIYDCKKVTIYDEKTGALVHGNIDKKNIIFIKRAKKGFFVVLDMFKDGGVGSHTHMEIQIPSNLYSNTNYTILSPDNLLYICDTTNLNDYYYNLKYLFYLSPEEVPKTYIITNKTQNKLMQNKPTLKKYKKQFNMQYKKQSNKILLEKQSLLKKIKVINNFITQNPSNILYKRQLKIYINRLRNLTIKSMFGGTIDFNNLITYIQNLSESDADHDFGKVFKEIFTYNNIKEESTILREAVTTNCNIKYKIILFNNSHIATLKESLNIESKGYIEDTTVLTENGKKSIGDLFANLASNYDPSSCGISQEIEQIDEQNTNLSTLFSHIISSKLVEFNLDYCNLLFNNVTKKYELLIKIKENFTPCKLIFPERTFSIGVVKYIIEKLKEISPFVMPSKKKTIKQNTHIAEPVEVPVVQAIEIDLENIGDDNSWSTIYNYQFSKFLDTKSDLVTFCKLFTFLKFAGDQLQVLFALIYNKHFLTIDRIAISSAITANISTFMRYPKTGEGNTDSIRGIIEKNDYTETKMFSVASSNEEEDRECIWFSKTDTIDWNIELNKLNKTIYDSLPKVNEEMHQEMHQETHQEMHQKMCKNIYEILTIRIPEFKYEISSDIQSSKKSFNLSNKTIDSIKINDTNTVITLEKISSNGSLTITRIYSKHQFNEFKYSTFKFIKNISQNIEYIRKLNPSIDTNVLNELIIKYINAIHILLFNLICVLEKFKELYAIFYRSCFTIANRETPANIERCNKKSTIATILEVFNNNMDFYGLDLNINAAYEFFKNNTDITNINIDKFINTFKELNVVF